LRQTDSSQRKADHLRICLESDVQATGITTGLEHYRLVHQGLPEMSLSDVNTSTVLAGKPLRFPLVVSAMTGGTPEAAAINVNLATAAQALGLAMVMGSQRSAIEKPQLAASYQVRHVAPDILLFANLGAVQLNEDFGVEECKRAVEMIEADGLALHLNPLQECLQPEGNHNFRNLADKIGAIAAELEVPVLVKEVGWGVSTRVATLLYNAGIRLLDVAGAGGTSWSRVERERVSDERLKTVAEAFSSWGIPTAESILNARQVSQDIVIIASGGIRTGVDVAKAIALGATAVGIALPLLHPATKSPDAVLNYLTGICHQLRVAMFCTASRNLSALSRAIEPVRPPCWPAKGADSS